MRYIANDFYCPICGKKNMSIPRNRGRMHPREHRKVLYCWRCKKTSNNIEIRTDEEALRFKQDWADGVYEEETKESIIFCENRLEEKIF